jgi:hypothetical protein
MSRQAVNQIIERAVGDEAFFEMLRNRPDEAIQGYELDASEASAFKSGAYNVVVRATRQDRNADAELQAQRAARASAPKDAPVLADTALQRPAKAPIAGLAGFFIGIVIIGGGLGAYRYFQSQWPWQTLGVGKVAAPAAIPSPSLGARPKPSGQPSRSAATSAVASPSASAQAAPPRSAAAKPAPSASAPAGTASQATLRQSPSASPSAAAASTAQQSEAQKAYFQAVGGRMATLLKSFAATLTDLRGGSDPTKDLSDLSNAASDLRQHLGDAPPPDQLKQQHQALTQAMPLFQAAADQLKSAVEQKNNVQALLVAAEMGALLDQVPDEVAFATAPHPELYQAIDSSQQLSHIQNFDVLSQNVTSRNSAPASVSLRIGLPSDNPSKDEVSDTLRHSVVAARQSFPQAGQVRVIAFKDANGSVGNQIGTADWYCSPDARPPDAGSSSGNWQDYCGKIYVSVPGSGGSGGNVTAVPY